MQKNEIKVVVDMLLINDSNYVSKYYELKYSILKINTNNFNQ